MGTTADKLQNILNAKADIGAAITEKGGTVPPKLIDYGKAIRALPAGGTSARQIQAGRDWIAYDNLSVHQATGGGPPIIGADGIFISCNPNAPGHLLRSKDHGASWEDVDISDILYDAPVDFAFGVGNFVADHYVMQQVLVSADKGLTWEPVWDHQGSVMGFLAFGGGVFLAAPGSSEICRSFDGGYTWSDPISTPLSYINAVAYGGGVFVAGGREHETDLYSSIIWSNDNGSTWNKVPLNAIENDGLQIVYGDGAFFMLDFNSITTGALKIFVSKDFGKTWVPKTVPNIDKTVPIYSICYGNGILVVNGSNYVLWSNDKGETFHKSLLSGQEMRYIAYTDGVFCGIGDTKTFVSFTGLTDQEVVSAAEEGS